MRDEFLKSRTPLNETEEIDYYSKGTGHTTKVASDYYYNRNITDVVSQLEHPNTYKHNLRHASGP